MGCKRAVIGDGGRALLCSGRIENRAPILTTRDERGARV